MVAVSHDCLDADGRTTIITRYTDQEQFWIIKSDVGVIEGPLDHVSFEEALIKDGLPVNTYMEAIDYRSNSSAYDALVAECKVLTSE